MGHCKKERSFEHVSDSERSPRYSCFECTNTTTPLMVGNNLVLI